jgi:hypothetical protein
VTAEGITRVFEFDPVADGARRVRVDWPGRKRILLPPLPKYTDVEGEFATVEVVEEDGESDGTLVLTHATGAVTLMIDDDDLGEARVRVEIPDEPGATVRVENIVWSPSPVVRIAPTVGGRPVGEDADVDALAGDPSDGHLTRLRTDQESEQVVVIERDWQEPRALEFHAVGLAPRRLVVPAEPAGVVPVAWGSAKLFLGVRTPDEEQPPFAIWFDGVLEQAEGGVLELGGIDAGEHTVIVGTAKHGSQKLVLNFARGVQRAIDIQFR